MNSVYESQDKVLLVHNQLAVLDTVKSQLEANSYEVDCVLGAEHAKLLCEVLTYSTIIIDKSMLRGRSLSEAEIICYLMEWHPKTRIMILDLADTVKIFNKLLPMTPATAH